MGLFDKVKNLFTEEIEEEPVVQKEVKKEEKIIIPEMKEEIEEKEDIKPTREEKFVYFTDDDFKDLEKPKVEPKKEEKKEEKKDKDTAYKGALLNKEEPKKEFKPSPIISPVYGVLDKNYDKDDIKEVKTTTTYKTTLTSIDDVRNKAFGTVEDEIKDDILGRTALVDEPTTVITPDIDIFDELGDFEEPPVKPKKANVDEIFGKLNDKKEEILDELDDKKEEILDELDEKKEDILKSDDFVSLNDDIEIPENDEKDIDDDVKEETTASDVEVAKELFDDDETLALAQELEEQKKKLKEINSMMDENEKIVKTKGKKKKKEEDEDLNESELFDLIDSSFETKDDE